MRVKKRLGVEGRLAVIIVLVAAILSGAVILRDANITGLTVEETANLPPIYTGPNNFLIQNDALLTVDLVTLFTDPENDALTFLVTEESQLNISLSDSILTITPDQGFVGERILTIVASDDVNVAREFVKLTVEGTGSFSTPVAITAPEPDPTLSSTTEPVEEPAPVELPEEGFGSQGFGTQALFPVHNITQCGTINFSSRLTTDISSNGTCIIFNSSDIFLDCAGFTITYGVAGGNNSIGVNITDQNNETVQNCIIRKGNDTFGFNSYGIGIFNTTNSTIQDNDIETNGTNNNDGIHTGTSSESEIVTGTVELVGHEGNINNPSCSNTTDVNSCKVCFTTGGVDCAVLGQRGCTDGEGYKTDTLIQFTPTSQPLRGNIQVIGGEHVRCFINDLSNLIINFGTRNNCGIFVSSTFNESVFATVGAQNNLTCQVAGGGKDEDNGFKLVSFTYEADVEVVTTSSNSSGITIINNNITAAGGVNTRGIFLDAHNSNISFNNITTFASNNSHGIFVVAENTSITSNNITAFLGPNSRGILVQSLNVNITSNVIVVNGGKDSEGILVLENNANITFNRIATNATNGSHGIALSAANATIANNNISTNSELGHGIFMDSAVTGSSISNNSITVLETGSDGIHLLGAVGNIFINNTVITATRAALHLERALNNIFNQSTITLVNTSLFILEDDGSINFTETIVLENETNLSAIIQITFNSTVVDTTGSDGQQLNRSAVLRFFSLPADGVRPVTDLQDDGTFEACEVCTDKSYNYTTGILQYEVSSFTTYAGAAVSDCGVFDLVLNESSTAFQLFNNILTNSSAACIKIAGDNLTFDCNGFSIGGNTVGVGINMTNVRNITLKHCLVENFSNNIVIDRTNYSLFWNNTARNSSDDSMRMFQSSHNMIRNSTSETTASSDEGLEMQNEPCYNNTLINNSFYAESGDGLRIASCSNNTLINNTGVSNDSSGIILTSSQNNTLIDNHGVGNGRFGNLGIFVRGLTSSQFGNNTLIRNNGTGRGEPGIELIESPNSLMIENIGISTSDHGIDIRESNRSVIIFNNGTSASAIGIRIFRSLEVNFSENNGTSNTSYGIGLIQHDNGANFIQTDRSLLVNNTGRSNSSDGIRIEGTADVTLIDNNGTSNTGRGIFMVGDDSFGEAGFSYIIDAYNGTWTPLEEAEHFPRQDSPDRYLTKIIGLPGGTTRVNLTHRGSETAHLDQVLLDGNAPQTITDTLLNITHPISKLSTADYDVIDAVERTIEIVWAQPGSVMTMTAIEEDVIVVPDYWPRDEGFAEYTLGASELFAYKVTPYSAHPFGAVYLNLSATADTLIARLDYTPDNTYDQLADWAKLGIETPEGELKEFRVNNTDTTWGTAAYEYTDKVVWQYKTYNFSIPLSEIGASPGDTISFQLEYYGTGGISPPCQDNTLANNIGFSVTGNGIHINSCNNMTLTNNTGRSSSGGHGIFMTAGDNNTFTDNRGISNTSGIGILLVGSANNNTFTNNRATSDSGVGFAVSASKDNILGNNTITSNTGDGLLINGSSATVNFIENNTVSSTSSRAILLSSSSASTLINNTATSDPSDAIRVSSSDSNIFTNNTVTTSNGTGINLVSSSSNVLENNTALGNSGSKISLLDSAANTFYNNQLAGDGGILVNLNTRSANFSDDFESNSTAAFNSSGNAVWVINNTTPLSGSFSAQSGNIGSSQSVSLNISLNFSTGGGIIKYTRNVSSESGFDFLRFLIDDVAQESISGEVQGTVSFEVTEGEHNLSWRYFKDSGVDSGRDDALLDDITTIGTTTNDFNTTILRSNATWIFSDNNSNDNNFTNTTFEAQNGSINLPLNLSLPNSTNASISRLNITFNLIHLNSVILQALNVTGILTFRGITSTDPQPIVDFDDDASFENCGTSICNEDGFTGGIFVYNVTGFTTYSSNETINVSGAVAATGGQGGGSGGRRQVFIKPKKEEQVAGACVESWACEEWSKCENSKQSRVCVDLGTCNTTLLMPLTKRACEMPVVEQPVVEFKPPQEELPAIVVEETPIEWCMILTLAIDGALLVLAVLILLHIVLTMRKKNKNHWNTILNAGLLAVILLFIAHYLLCNKVMPMQYLLFAILALLIIIMHIAKPIAKMAANISKNMQKKSNKKASKHLPEPPKHEPILEPKPIPKPVQKLIPMPETLGIEKMDFTSLLKQNKELTRTLEKLSKSLKKKKR